MAPASGWSRARISISAFLPRAASVASSSNTLSKWSSITPLLRPVTNTKCSMPASLASSTTYWMSGLSTMVSISFGIALVAGRTRVPRPATGKTALRIFMAIWEGLERAGLSLEHDPEKWEPVFGQDHAQSNWHVGTRFAAGNKGGCVVRRKSRHRSPAFVKLLETGAGPCESGIFGQTGQGMKRLSVPSMIARAGALALAATLLSPAVAGAQSSGDGVGNFLNNLFAPKPG